jgi:hypothetical protein
VGRYMINAMNEILEMLFKYDKTIDNIKLVFVLVRRQNYTTFKVNNLNDLDFDYDPGFGAQNLMGFILLDDNDWLERAEYDGAEEWVYKKYPTELLENSSKHLNEFKNRRDSYQVFDATDYIDIIRKKEENK